MSFRKLPRSFYLRPTLRVAKELLGCYLVRRLGRQRVIGRIVEVEAYHGSHDSASHAYKGKTQRNEVMFRKGGHLYVYFTYGMHFCANVVTEKEGTGHAVLLRAVEPIEGEGTMRKNRGKQLPQVRLTNGPAKLCQAFGIGREENGTDLTGNEIFLARGEPLSSSQISTSKRIGIKKGTDKQWRFYVKGNLFVSKQ